MSPSGRGRIHRLMEGMAKRSRSNSKNSRQLKTNSKTDNSKRARASAMEDSYSNKKKRKTVLPRTDAFHEEADIQQDRKMEKDESETYDSGAEGEEEEEEEEAEEETDEDEGKTVKTIVKVPTSKDVLIGTGRSCSSHAGNRAYQDEIMRLHQTYVNATVKKTVVESAVNFVIERGGRFLSKSKKGPDAWVVVESRMRLCRNARKCFNSAHRKHGISAPNPHSDKQNASRTSAIAALSPSPKKADRNDSESKRTRSRRVGKKEANELTTKPKAASKNWLQLEKELAVDTLIGARVSIIWDVDGIYSLGTIMQKKRQGKVTNGNNDKYLVKYDDSDISEWLDFNEQAFQVIKDAERTDQPGTEPANFAQKAEDDSELKQRREKVWWTPAEDEALRKAVEKHGGIRPHPWSEIAKDLPGRLPWQCRQRWVGSHDSDFTSKPLTQEESRALIQLQSVHGNKWRHIAADFPTKRTTKFVRHMFQKTISPLVQQYLREQRGVSIDSLKTSDDGRFEYLPGEIEGLMEFVEDNME